MADLKLILFAGALVASAAGGWVVRDLQADAEELARLESEKRITAKMQELADKIDTSTTKAISNIRIENRTIHQKAIHEIQTNTIYADCVLPESGRLRINAARSSANAAGARVPAAADAAGGR